MIPYGRQNIDQKDIDAVIDVLKSDFLTQGPVVPKFEQAVADYCGAQYGVAVNSATSALHLACLALGVGKGDIVWTSPISFVASANCALYCGANIDFIDVDPLTGNLSVDELSHKLKITPEKLLPKVIVVIHMAGNPCDVKSIAKLTQTYNIKIIEDASHALGAEYQIYKVGCCAHSDITVFSFHPVKIITTGEGGMALTNDLMLSERMKTYASHGITKDSTLMEMKAPWYYEQQSIGYNYRMSEIHAALGFSQMNRLDIFIQKRRRIADYYNKNLCTEKFEIVKQDEFGRSSYHLYMILVKNDKRRPLYEKMKANGVGVQVHYIPIHLQPFYRSLGFNLGDFPNSEEYYKDILTIPIHPALEVEQVNYIIGTLNEY